MAQMQKLKMADTPQGEVYMFRISNNRSNYVDITNLGGKLAGIYTHKPNGDTENILYNGFIRSLEYMQSTPIGSVLGDELDPGLCTKVWDVVQEGADYVMFATETEDNIRIGLKIQWVNLDRLIVDIFMTPKNTSSVSISSRLYLQDKPYEIASFCPEVSGKNVAETAYKNMAFVPLSKTTGIFSHHSEEIKPMMECKDSCSPLRISSYNTFTAIKADRSNDQILITHFNPASETIQSGETLTQRVIYGVDYITADLHSDETDPESPFIGFINGGLCAIHRTDRLKRIMMR